MTESASSTVNLSSLLSDLDTYKNLTLELTQNFTLMRDRFYPAKGPVYSFDFEPAGTICNRIISTNHKNVYNCAKFNFFFKPWILTLIVYTPPQANTDAFFLLIIGIVIFLMQGGFALLEAGSVR
jgi:hypothetical protein